jgi:hypothetical protein
MSLKKSHASLSLLNYLILDPLSRRDEITTMVSRIITNIASYKVILSLSRRIESNVSKILMTDIPAFPEEEL